MARPELFDHPKLLRLQRLLNQRASRVVGCLECMWYRARKARSSRLGIAVDVEAAADYDGDPGTFAEAAHAAGFLDKIDDVYYVHDLDDHAPKFPRPRVTVKQQSSDLFAAPEEPRSVAEVARPRNELFDAVAQVSGRDPKGNGGLIAAVVKKLKAFEPPIEPDEVLNFGQRFWELCPWAARDSRERPTPMEIANHIGLLRAKPAPPQAKPSGQQGFLDKATSRLLEAMKPRSNGDN